MRISDILRRGRPEEEEPRKKRPEEEAKIKKEGPLTKPTTEPEKKETPSGPKGEAIKEEEQRPAVSQVHIARVIMPKTELDSPQAEKVYQELITLIQEVFTKATKGELLEGKEIALKIATAVDHMVMANNELIALFLEKATPDNYLWGHSVNVCLLATKIGLSLGYNKSKLYELGISGFLHDIGKVRVMDIVQQPRKLTKQEYEEVKQHPVYAIEILKQASDLPEKVIAVASEHHERLDGSGYPKGIKGNQVDEYAQVVGLVDIYEAITHQRPYRQKMLAYIAMKEIVSDRAKFNPRLLKILIEEVGIYPIASWVELNTDEVGKVVRLDKKFPLRPVIKVVLDASGQKLEEMKSIELVKYPTLYIKKALDDSELERKK